jgi:hypothetical protein
MTTMMNDDGCDDGDDYNNDVWKDGDDYNNNDDDER